MRDGAGVAVARLNEALHQIITACARNGIFASGVNIRDSNHICVIETGAEVIEQVVQTAVAVRLMHGDHPPLARLARGLEHGGNFRRVMAVVVNDRHAVNFAHFGKAAVNPAKTGQRGTDFV